MYCSIPPKESGGHLIIDLSALVANWKLLAAKAPHSECAAVVKADGYGTQIAVVCPALAKAGCKTFFVTYLAEAKEIRQLLPDVSIYVLNELFPNTAEMYRELNVHPVLGSTSECEEWASFSGNDIGAALHVDTGINRLGFRVDEFEKWLNDHRGVPPFKVTLLMSHLACGSEPDHPLNAKQIALFKALRQKLPTVKASLANSSGIFLSPETHHDVVRPGYALYGGNPTPGKPNPMHTVITIKAKIIKLRTLLPGDTIGYGGAFLVKQPMRVATISDGYADGIFRSAIGNEKRTPAEVVIAGRRCRLIGGVSMDMIHADITHIPESDVKRGDFAEILGPNISIDELAAHAGTIGYEVLTSLGKRYTRTVTTSASS